MALYTPVQIITAGMNDTRHTFAHLYDSLEQARQEVDLEYHLAFIGELPEGTDRLPYYPAPAGFGGNEIARVADTVDLTRLTYPGILLYRHGVLAAVAEEQQLHVELLALESTLVRMRLARTGAAHQVVARTAQAHDARAYRATHMKHDDPGPGNWGDAPVRTPGIPDYR